MNTTTNKNPRLTCDIGFGRETFESIEEVSRAVRTRVSGIESGRDWYARCRSKHGPRINDERGRAVATVSYNGRLWNPTGAREEIVIATEGGAS